MRRSGAFVLALCVLGVAGCNDAATAPSNVPIVLTAQLLPANEVPPVANAESTSRGAVQISFDITRDANGTITSGTATFHFQLSGPTPAIVGAHIHTGAAGVNGGVIVNTGISSGAPATATNGLITFTSGAISVAPATLSAILGNPGAYYFNIHSVANPGGVARGQLVRTS